MDYGHVIYLMDNSITYIATIPFCSLSLQAMDVWQSFISAQEPLLHPKWHHVPRKFTPDFTNTEDTSHKDVTNCAVLQNG